MEQIGEAGTRSMDELKLLTLGIAVSRGNKSRHLRFARAKEVPSSPQNISNVFNFFGESRCADPTPSIDHGIQTIEESNDDDKAAWFNSQEEVNAYRRQNRIYTYSGKKKMAANSAPWPIKQFQDLETQYNVNPWVIQNIVQYFKFKTPSSIQKQAIPCILTGQPLLATAPTGSGKTLAFLLPLIVLMKAPSKQFLRSLVIVPSRELAVQTIRELDVLRGHKNFRSQILEKQTSLQSHERKRLDFGVTTPMKLVQLLRDGQISLTETRHIVLDEADKLLDMGFAPQIDEILSHVDLDNVQIMLFSATLPDNVLTLAESIISGATRIAVGAPMSAASEIEQHLMFVTKEEGKLTTFRQLVADGKISPPTLVFVQSIERAKQLFKELVFDGIFADVIHAERTKAERDRVIQGFRERKIWVLICTDLMARGVDFKGVQVVINWDLPQSAATYIHRIGRTGRAGRTGSAITFFTLDDVKYLPAVVGVMRQSGCDVPNWMLQIKKLRKKHKRKFERKSISRGNILTAVIDSNAADKQWKAVRKPKLKRRMESKKSH